MDNNGNFKEGKRLVVNTNAKYFKFNVFKNYKKIKRNLEKRQNEYVSYLHKKIQQMDVDRNNNNNNNSNNNNNNLKQDMNNNFDKGCRY